jgi:hypothetical protein
MVTDLENFQIIFSTFRDILYVGGV